MAEPAIIIRGAGVASALGLTSLDWGRATPAFESRPLGTAGAPVTVAPLAADAEASLKLLRAEADMRPLDRATLLAVLAARQATRAAGWDAQPDLETAAPLGVAIGSSRGATGRLESDHARFLDTGTTPAATSPLTTPGHLASAVARDLGRGVRDQAGPSIGAVISHAATCSSAVQALGTAWAWLHAGLADTFLAGGTEAPLTPFTIAQMRAVGIYSRLAPDAWPCRPAALPAEGTIPTNTFVLGEGAAIFALERGLASAGEVIVAAVGFGFERAASKTGITPAGEHFQQAMRQALRLAALNPAEVDAVVLHAPGTAAGDAAELAAVRAVFGSYRPELLTPKWLLGHTLGASAALSLDFARWLITTGTTVSLPPLPYPNSLVGALGPPQRERRVVVVNAAGFGGSAGCVVLRRV